MAHDPNKSNNPFKKERRKSKRDSGKRPPKMKFASSTEKQFFSQLNPKQRQILREGTERNDYYALTVSVENIAKDLRSRTASEEEALLLAKKLKFEAQKRRGKNWQPAPEIVKLAEQTFTRVKPTQKSLNKSTGRGY